MIAAIYGVSAETDAYFFALIVPLTMGTVLMEAAYTASLPAIRATTLGRSKAFRTTTLTALTLFFGYVVLLVGIRPTQLPVWLSLSPLIVVLAITGVYAAVLVNERRYALATMRLPMAAGLAVVLIASFSRISQSILTASLCFSVAYASVLILIAVIARQRIMPDSLQGAAHAPSMTRSLGAAVAAVAASGPLIILVERALASTLNDGALTLLAYARGLALFPLLLPAAVANGVFAAAVDHVQRSERQQLRRLAITGIRLGVVSALLATLLIAVRQREFVRIALERGEFSRSDAGTAANLVGIMAASVIGLGATVVGTRVLFALSERRLVTLIGGGTLLGYAAVGPLFATMAGPEGLAAAYALVSIAAGLITLFYVTRVLAVRPRDALREWLLAPVLLGLPFAAGVGFATLLVPASRDLAGAVFGVITSLAAGLVCLGATLVFARPTEFHILRQALQGRVATNSKSGSPEVAGATESPTPGRKQQAP